MHSLLSHEAEITSASDASSAWPLFERLAQMCRDQGDLHNEVEVVLTVAIDDWVYGKWQDHVCCSEKLSGTDVKLFERIQASAKVNIQTWHQKQQRAVILFVQRLCGVAMYLCFKEKHVLGNQLSHPFSLKCFQTPGL